MDIAGYCTRRDRPRRSAARAASEPRAAGSFDYLVGANKQGSWHGETERLRGPAVDHQFVFGLRAPPIRRHVCEYRTMSARNSRRAARHHLSSFAKFSDSFFSTGFCALVAQLFPDLRAASQ